MGLNRTAGLWELHGQGTDACVAAHNWVSLCAAHVCITCQHLPESLAHTRGPKQHVDRRTSPCPGHPRACVTGTRMEGPNWGPYLLP